MTSVIDPIALGLEVTGMAGVEAHCMCPFHEDTTQSASFNTERGVFFCFGCKKTAYTMEIAKELAGRIIMTQLGLINVPVHSHDTPDWRWVLSAKKAYGNSYLASRGVSDAMVDEFNIREYDDGVIFPLNDIHGNPIGGQVRMYKGTMRYMFYGERPELWPMDRLGESPKIVLVEGIFGALRARAHGHAAFSLMSAAVASRAIPFIRGFREKICVFDNDKAGWTASKMFANAGIGAKVYWPGAETDEEGKEFYDGLTVSPNLVTFVL